MRGGGPWALAAQSRPGVHYGSTDYKSSPRELLPITTGMTQQQFRLALTIVIAIVLVFGLYLGWHFTHPHQACGYHGGFDANGQPAYTCHPVGG